MNTASTLAAYALALAVVFGAAAGVGHLVGPVGPASPGTPGSGHEAGSHDAGGDEGKAHQAGGHEAGSRKAGGHETGGHGAEGHRAGRHEGTGPDAGPGVGGLAVAQDGYALRLARTTAPAGERFTLDLTLTGPDGEPVRSYEREHDEELHLVVVRRDLTGYQHLHPVRDAAGRWSLPLVLREPGTYKVIADFTPTGRATALALAADLVVPGRSAPAPLPAPQRSVTADGLTVDLDGQLTAGRTSELTFTVTRDGRPVRNLDPYLGAYGHLVVLRAGDAAYLHVHPDESGGPGPEVVFGAEVPAAGSHRLFLDFSVDGVARTAAFTAVAAAPEDGAR